MYSSARKTCLSISRKCPELPFHWPAGLGGKRTIQRVNGCAFQLFRIQLRLQQVVYCAGLMASDINILVALARKQDDGIFAIALRGFLQQVQPGFGASGNLQGTGRNGMANIVDTVW